MFFVASKIFWLLVQPVSLSLLFALLALALMLAHRHRAASLSLLLGIAFLFLSAFTNVGYLLLAPLEDRFPQPERLPAGVAGIIVLGGGMDAEVNAVRGGYELNRAGDRFLEALRLANQLPDAQIVFTGGVGDLDQSGEPEAAAARRFFLALGIPDQRLLLESKSRNTAENAEFTKALVKPQPGQTWLLVTSAYHMPRSVGLFRKAGFEVVPWPVDYRGTGRESFALTTHQPAENLAATTAAVREWIGLAAYALSGRIDELLPGPQ